MSSAESPGDLLTTYQAAALLGISVDALIRAIDRGSLPAIVIDGALPRRQQLRLRRADVEAYRAGRKSWKRKDPDWQGTWPPVARRTTPPGEWSGDKQP